MDCLIDLRDRAAELTPAELGLLGDELAASGCVGGALWLRQGQLSALSGLDWVVGCVLELAGPIDADRLDDAARSVTGAPVLGFSQAADQGVPDRRTASVLAATGRPLWLAGEAARDTAALAALLARVPGLGIVLEVCPPGPPGTESWRQWRSDTSLLAAHTSTMMVVTAATLEAPGGALAVEVALAAVGPQRTLVGSGVCSADGVRARAFAGLCQAMPQVLGDGWQARNRAVLLGVAARAMSGDAAEVTGPLGSIDAEVRRMEALSLLARGLNHEFNNLLVGIIGAAECIEDELEDPDLCQLADTVIDSGERAARLVKQLRTLFDWDTRQPLPVDVHAVIDLVGHLCRRALGRNVRLDVQLRARNPRVLADAPGLHAALVLMLLRARDAMPDGGTVVVSTADVVIDAAGTSLVGAELAPGAYAAIRVRDTGPGVERGELDRLLQPSPRRRASGAISGDLWTAWQEAQAAGGGLTVDSLAGEGTVVTFYLPVPTHRSAPESADESQPAGTGGRILLVDDDDIVRRITRRTLERQGHEVVEAANGHRAVALARQRHFDLAVLDIVMPELDGLESLRHLREVQPDLQAVLCSGYLFHLGDQDAADAVGVAGFVQKPYTSKELGAEVARCLRGTNDTASEGDNHG